MIRLKGQLRCMTADEVQTVQLHKAEHIRLTRAEPGCLTFDITETDDPMTFEVMESFRDREAFDTHQIRTRESHWFQETRHILRDFVVEELRD